MRLNPTILAILLSILAVGTVAGTAQAAVGRLVIAAVVSNCPFKTNGVCADAVKDFLDLQSPGAERDTDIVALVEALARAAKHPNITTPMCVELQRSIRILGKNVTQSAPQKQIEEIAARLCEGRTITGAVGGGKENDWTPPASLIDQPPAENPPTSCYNSYGDVVTCE